MAKNSKIHVKNPTQMRKDLFEALEKSSEGSDFFIPHKNGTAILMDLDKHQSLVEELETLKDINAASVDYLENRTLSVKEVRNRLAGVKEQWLKTAKRKSS